VSANPRGGWGTAIRSIIVCERGSRTSTRSAEAHAMNNLSPPALTANADGDIPSQTSEGSVPLLWSNSGCHTSASVSDSLAGAAALSSGTRCDPRSAAAQTPVQQEATMAIKTTSPLKGTLARMHFTPDRLKVGCSVSALMIFY